MNIRRQFAKLLREIADRIDVGNTDLDEDQTLELMRLVVHQPMSKASAAKHLNMSISKFDNLVRDGWLPKGRKILGWKELRWYQDELDRAASRLDE